jgi:hypothetical protein
LRRRFLLWVIGDCIEKLKCRVPSKSIAARYETREQSTIDDGTAQCAHHADLVESMTSEASFASTRQERPADASAKALRRNRPRVRSTLLRLTASATMKNRQMRRFPRVWPETIGGGGSRRGLA